MKKGDLLRLEITDINNLGCGVGRLDGKVVFVKGAVTGDTVCATVIKDNKSFAVARLEKIESPSPFRMAEDICDTPLSCGGCVYRHITYEHEKEIKYYKIEQYFAFSQWKRLKNYANSKGIEIIGDMPIMLVNSFLK